MCTATVVPRMANQQGRFWQSKFGTGKGDVLAQHIKQSFKGQEVTPEQALEIGIKPPNACLKINIST